jgi:hypothetical protein
MQSIPTMSGCTIGPDGELLDAKYIEWYKDGDLLEPINQATSSDTTPNSSTTIRPFFMVVQPLLL